MSAKPGKSTDRRTFIKHMAGGIVAGSSSLLAIAKADDSPAAVSGNNTAITDKDAPIREFLKQAVLKREQIDKFLDPAVANWAQFDPDLGYVMKSSMMRDGMDGAFTIARYDKKGYRKLINFPDRPCRINTYGNSFTQCHQVSDGQTWQEILAAHFGEPIRNFGCGGYGVYQAYLRMLRTEMTDLAAPYIVLNIWGDDHHRSIMSYRYLYIFQRWHPSPGAHMFHANPADHLAFDPDTGNIIERDNVCRTKSSLYNLCNEDFVYETFKDDLLVRIMMCQRNHNIDTVFLEQLAESLNLKLNFRSSKTRPAAATTLYNECAWKASMYIIEKLKTFTDKQQKKLLVLLSYPGPSISQACSGTDRDDAGYMDWHPRRFREFLQEKKIRFLDSMDKHLEDFKTFKLTPDQYMNRYYIGHYNPKGNHFFAYAVKDEFVNWLQPKPPTYRAEGDIIRFKGYLPD